jgi:hypothetical protein
MLPLLYAEAGNEDAWVRFGIGSEDNKSTYQTL